MSTIQKLIDRFKERPKDFSWDELARLLNHFGYEEISGSGSRRKFIHDHRQPIILHQPHPGKTLKIYQMNQLHEVLQEEQFI